MPYKKLVGTSGEKMMKRKYGKMNKAMNKHTKTGRDSGGKLKISKVKKIRPKP